MNSSIEIAEAAKLAQKLIDRTVEGKLFWEAVEIAGMSVQARFYEDRFSTRLEPNLRATVSQSGRENLSFSLVENPESRDLISMVPSSLSPSREKVVIDVSIEKDPPYGYSTPQEKLLAGLLVDLYGLARRSALKMDASVERVLSYLDRIAG